MTRYLKRIIPFVVHYHAESSSNVELDYKEALLKEALHNGLLDKPVQISFIKEEYDNEQKEQAIEYLNTQYCFLIIEEIITPMQWAVRKYNEIKPFNLILVIEEEKENGK